MQFVHYAECPEDIGLLVGDEIFWSDGHTNMLDEFHDGEPGLNSPPYPPFVRIKITNFHTLLGALFVLWAYIIDLHPTD